jgi:hypothetical protein
LEYEKYLGLFVYTKKGDNNNLYRCGLSADKLEFLNKIKSSDTLIKFEETDDVIDDKPNPKFYKMPKLACEIRIQDVTKKTAKKMLCDLIDFIIHCLNNGVCVWDVSESNFLYYNGKTYWVDLDAFSNINDEHKNYYYTFVKVSYLFNKYIKKNLSIQNAESANCETIAVYQDWTTVRLGSNFNNPALWSEFKDIIINTDSSAGSTHWSKEYASNHHNISEDKKAKIVQKIIKPAYGGMLLDVGANKGYYLNLLKDNFDTLIGVDTDEECINIASNEYMSDKINFVNFGIQDFNQVPDMRITRFKSDIVMCLALTHHLHNMQMNPTVSAKTLCDLSSKWILIEDIKDIPAYIDEFIKNGFKLYDRVKSYPSDRFLSLWSRS